MLTAHLPIIAHWLYQFESLVPAVLITAGAAFLLGCGVSAVCSPREESDSVFHNPVV